MNNNTIKSNGRKLLMGLANRFIRDFAEPLSNIRALALCQGFVGYKGTYLISFDYIMYLAEKEGFEPSIEL